MPPIGRLASWCVLSAALAACGTTTGTSGPPARSEVAREAYLDGDAERAAREARLALQRDPLDAESHFLLGCVLAGRGEDDQAIVGFRRAFTLDPVHPAAAYNLGTIHLRREEAVPAARWFETAVTTRPDHVPSYNNLGKAYFQAGLPELAVAAWEEALRLDPSSAVALGNLATVHEAGGRAEEAASYRRRLAALGAEATPESRRAPPSAASASAAPVASVAAGPSPVAMPDPAAEDPSPRDPAADGPPPPAPATELGDLRELLRDLPHVTVDLRAGRPAVSGWTSGPAERARLDRVLAAHADVLDLTTDDVGDPQRLIEVDATIFLVIAADTESLGFNFLRLIDFSFRTFATDHHRDGGGFLAPGLTGSVSGEYQSGWFVSASTDYDVNIANASAEKVAVLARPHLTTLSGTPATFLAGGEYIFQVSGLNSGDIKLYPFGTKLTVTPTLLRTPSPDGRPRVHLAVDAGRTSILGFLTATNPANTTVFDKVEVTSQAVVGIGETLIVSGLSQTERREVRSGVPILSSIPILKYFFSQSTTVESNTAVIILLTPRDPAFVDERGRADLAEFVEKRRAFVAARQGSAEDFRRYRERYPEMSGMPPNRFASHFFLLRTSDLYRRVTGQDLAAEDLEFDLLGTERLR